MASRQNLAEIPPPEYPPALKLAQEKWETNKEFEDRITSSRYERQREIERIQSDYKAKVSKRNYEIQRLAPMATQTPPLMATSNSPT